MVVKILVLTKLQTVTWRHERIRMVTVVGDQ